MGLSRRQRILQDEVNATKWTVDVIQDGLGIDAQTYSTIYTAIEHDLLSRGIIGQKLNTRSTRTTLRPTFEKVYRQYPDVFENIPDLLREKCAIAIAQKCNANKKRQRNRQRKRDVLCVQEKLSTNHLATATTSSRTLATLAPSLSTHLDHQEKPAKPFALTVISICSEDRSDKRWTLYRPCDLLNPNLKQQSDDPLDNLSFDKLRDLLEAELSFDRNSDAILHQSPCGNYQTGLIIDTERLWKAAIAEMLGRRAEQVIFYIRRSVQQHALQNSNGTRV